MNNNEEIYYEFFGRKTDDEMLRKGRIQRAEREAEKRGMNRGQQKERRNIIKNMCKAGMEIPEISKITFIPEAEIKQLLR